MQSKIQAKGPNVNRFGIRVLGYLRSILVQVFVCYVILMAVSIAVDVSEMGQVSFGVQKISNIFIQLRNPLCKPLAPSIKANTSPKGKKYTSFKKTSALTY